MTEFVAIDVGTSFTKGGIVDSAASQIRDVTRHPAPPRLAHPSPNFYEIDPRAVLDGVRDLVVSLIEKTPNCKGVLICGQMGGLILCDDRSQPVRPYISWVDKRTTVSDGTQPSIFDRLTNIVGDRKRSVLGNEVRPGLPLSTLSWLHKTGELQRYPGVYPVSLPDFVASALCGMAPVMEWTNTPGLLDVAKREFAFPLFEELGLTNLRWPKIVDFRHCVGEFRANGRTIPVYAATGDHQCSLTGTLLRREELSINVSTGSQISILTEDFKVGDFQLRSHFDGMLLRTVTNIPGGRALSAIVKLLAETNSSVGPEASAWKYFFQQAELVESTDVEASLAFFPGTLKGPGHFSNLSEDNMTVSHIARAALEEMADTYRSMSHRIADPDDWFQVALSGGVSQQSPLLRTLIAQRLNASIRLSHWSEDALAGLMTLGRVIAGMEGTVAEACRNVLAEQLSS